MSRLYNKRITCLFLFFAGLNAFFKILLSPFALVFWLITSIRNWFYKKNIFKATEFDIPIICVGNLAVGGSGKTPMVEYLINNLKSEYNIAILSRGYGRKTTGFKWVEPSDNFADTGDEPLQIKQKYPNISVAVCEKRVDGVIQILAEKPSVDLIILDDAFQHRAIKAAINLVLTEYSTPYFKDWIMPIGRLRESRRGIQRADAIIFTKCPSQYSKYASAKIPSFYSKIQYNNPIITGEVYGFSGLANNSLFHNHLKQNFKLKGFKGYRDHYNFTTADITSLLNEADGAQLVCTEKDYIKLKSIDGSKSIKYITIENQIEGDENFINWIKNKVEIES